MNSWVSAGRNLYLFLSLLLGFPLAVETKELLSSHYHLKLGNNSKMID